MILTELNELIYARAKLVREKIGIPLKMHEEKIKTRMGNSTGKADKKATKTGKKNKQRRDAGTRGDKKEKATQGNMTIQLEEIDQKVLAKEGRLKRYRQRVKQYRLNGTFQNNERKFYQQIEETTRKHTNNRMEENPNNFGIKYGNQENIIKKNEWKSNIIKELEGPKREIHIDSLKTTLKKYQIGKSQAMMKYMDSGSRNLPLFTTV